MLHALLVTLHVALAPTQRRSALPAAHLASSRSKAYVSLHVHPILSPKLPPLVPLVTVIVPRAPDHNSTSAHRVLQIVQYCRTEGAYRHVPRGSFSTKRQGAAKVVMVVATLVRPRVETIV